MYEAESVRARGSDGSNLMIVPALDRMIGLEVYSTRQEGIAGRIKVDGHVDFMVEEIVDLDGVSISSIRDGRHRYPVFRLRKEGIDTIHALIELESIYRFRLRPLGLKDAHAATVQYVIADEGTAGGKEGGMELRTKHCLLTLVGYADRMLRKRDLVGNRFTVTIHTDSMDESCLRRIQDVIVDVKARKVGNFYGYQRFGSTRPVTHLVGRAMVKRRFRDAVDAFLTYTSEHDTDREIRLLLRLKGSYGRMDHQIMERIPHNMDLERELVKGMIECDDPVKALRRLPVEIRRLFIEAYQAYIFNRALSTAIIEGYDISEPSEGDICFRIGRDNRIGGILKYDDSSYSRDCSSPSYLVPAMQLVGYTFRPLGRFGRLVDDVMREEEVTARDFYIKEMQEVSVEGGFRPLALLLLQDRFEIVDVRDKSITIRFALPKGSYATTLLREIIKPQDPVTAGF